LRWKPPTPPVPHPGVADASGFGPECLQFDDDGKLTGSEDCLSLNVWTPASLPVFAGRPVLFFIHGGGNVQGAGSVSIYDGQFLARTFGAVVVTVNYRLSALGYLAHPFLDDESPRAVSGNYGILDLVFALDWVRKNIRSFGGDPARVLVFGESAGAVDTCTLMASPLAKGLFSAALMQSGGCSQPPLADVEEFGETIVKAAGCAASNLAFVRECMRAKPAEEIVSAVPPVILVYASSGQLYGPAVDGWVLPKSPYDALVDGTHNHVPFVIGANADETSRSVPAMPSVAAYEAAIRLQFSVFAPLILSQYPAANYESVQKAYIALTTDSRFVCPSRRIARAAAASQREGVFRYFFTHVLDSSPARNDGAFHGLELPFVFGTLGSIRGFRPSPGEMELSRAMGEAWFRMAETGRAEVSGITWPEYDPVSDPYLRFGNGLGIEYGVRTENCDFWDRFVEGPR
jgi:para-nitrobenzyl esterase